MTTERLSDLIAQFRTGRMGRRQFVQRATALGLSMSAIGSIVGTRSIAAQEGQATQSITREEYAQALFEAFPMSEPASSGGQIIVGDSTDIGTVNGMLTSDQPTSFITGAIFETLQGSSVIDGQPVPGLADYWELAADGITYTFHLNQNIAWHDGTPMTTADVEFSFQAQLDPLTGSQYTSTLAAIVTSYRVIDDFTFEVVSNGQLATFMIDMYVPIMPKHVWEGVPFENWLADPGSNGQDPSRVVGTGPFKFVEWVQNDHVTLVKNESYWDTVTGRVPVIDEYIFRVLPDDNAAVQALKTGEIDVFEVIPAPQTEEIQNTEGLKVDIYDTFDFSFWGYNMDPGRSTLFQDKQVRQALIIGTDREAITENIYLGYGEVAIGTQGKLSIAYAPDQIAEKYAYDPERAKALLAEAGWTDTNDDGVVEKDGMDLAFQCILPAGQSTTEQVAAYLQEAWAEIGVSMTPQFIPFPSLVDAITRTHFFEMAILGFSWDASGGQEALFGCDQYEGGFNFMKYCNEAGDALNEQQKHELDPEKRKELLIELSNIVWEDAPVGIFRFGVGRTGYSDRLQNYYPNDYGFLWSLPWVWIQG